MKFKVKILFLLLLTVIQNSVAQNPVFKNEQLILSTLQKDFTAGSFIRLDFKTNTDKKYQLYCTNSYGSTLVDGKIDKEILSFTIPDFMSTKKGVLNWSVLGVKYKTSGQIQILPKEKPKAIETYLGPPSIAAGNIDYTMATVIPVDDLDNPLQENTAVQIKTQFLTTQKNETIFTKNLIGYQNIYAPLRSGRMLVSSEVKGLNSKEFDVVITPALATTFTVLAKRNHNYADGNQITTFLTSIIKDENENVISDGTFVDFFMTNNKGNILKTSGTTIGGIASAKMVHPDFEDIWQVKAYITGIAESNTIEIAYKNVVNTIDVQFSKTNRIITVGPIQSFMKQLIPDGLQVKLAVFKNDKLDNEIVKTTKDGFVFFKLNPNIYKNGTYKFIITTAGISKTFKAKKVW